MSNPHEDAAREKKALALVSVIDRFQEHCCVGLSDSAARGLNEDFPRALRKMSADWWIEMSKRARVRPPSSTTLEQIFAVYDRRALDAQTERRGA